MGHSILLGVNALKYTKTLRSTNFRGRSPESGSGTLLTCKHCIKPVWKGLRTRFWIPASKFANLTLLGLPGPLQTFGDSGIVSDTSLRLQVGNPHDSVFFFPID